VQLWQLHAERGHGERALAVVEQVATTTPERFAPVLAACLARLGRLDAARDQLARMRIPDDQSRCYVLSLAADAAAIVGDADLSATLRSDLEPWAGHHVVLGSGAICRGSASHFAGLAARTCGDLDAAASHLQDAVRMNDTIAATPAAARSRAELARTLLALGRAEEARALTTAATAEARRLGMAELLEQLAEM
jgi:hypothetical protein